LSIQYGIGGVRKPTHVRRSIMEARSVTPIEAVGVFGEIARHMLVADGAVGTGERRLDMLPSTVLTHLKAGWRADTRPEPVTMGWCVQPALVTAVKQSSSSLTMVLIAPPY
jgi:hypothetical protein